MTPKIVVFDLGKVLVDFDYIIAARRIAARAALPPGEVKDLLLHTPWLDRYETGRMTRAELFDEVCQKTRFRGTIEEFSDFFADIFTPIPPMIELHAALRRQGIPTYIFSNTNDLAVEHIQRSFLFFAHFDGYIFSHEIGVMKPDAKMYEALERLAGRRGGEIFYLDDRAENVAAGAARGWQVILHEAPEKTRAAMHKLGLLNTG